MKRIKLFEEFLNEDRGYRVTDRPFWNKTKTEKEIEQLEEEVTDLKDQLNGLFRDMEAEAGEKGEAWTDDDANEYGKKMNDIEEEIKAKEKKIESLEKRFGPRGPRKSKEPSDVDDVKKILKKNIADIKNSQRIFPDRTEKEQAEIYKKRFNIRNNIKTNDIISAMKSIGI